MTEHEGYQIELALQLGFEMLNDDGDVYACTERQLLDFAKRIENAAKGIPNGPIG